MEMAMGNFKKICIISFILCIILNCNFNNTKMEAKEMAQNQKETHNVFANYTPAKQFDIKKFNAKSNGNIDYQFVDNNGMEVYQLLDEEYPSEKVNGYYEKRKYPNSAYTFVSGYDASGLLTHTITRFYDVQFGTIKYYDNSSKVIREDNLDIPYKFSVDDLIDKMKKEYDIDILNTKLIRNIKRYFEEKINMVFYEVMIWDLVIDGIMHIYLINGNTGETLLITNRETEWSRQPKERVVDEYIRKKANGE